MEIQLSTTLPWPATTLSMDVFRSLVEKSKDAGTQADRRSGILANNLRQSKAGQAWPEAGSSNALENRLDGRNFYPPCTGGRGR